MEYRQRVSRIRALARKWWFDVPIALLALAGMLEVVVGRNSADAPEETLWFVLPGGTWTSTTTFSGNWYRVTGPAFNGTFDPSKVSVAQVGTAQLSFTDENHATLAFTVNGVTVSHDITRLPF